MTTEQDMIDMAGLAALTGVTIHAVYQWQKRGMLPERSATRPPRSPLWTRDVIENWLDATGRRLLDAKELAELAGVSPSTIARWRKEDLVPKPDHVDPWTKRELWRKEHAERFLAGAIAAKKG